MKMKKLLTVFTALFCCFITAFALTACEKNQGTASCDHVLVKHESVAATCLADGTKTYWQCEKCNKYFADEKATTEITQADTIEKSAGAHTFDGGYTCTKCGAQLLTDDFMGNLALSAMQGGMNGFSVTFGYEYSQAYNDGTYTKTNSVKNGEIVCRYTLLPDSEGSFSVTNLTMNVSFTVESSTGDVSGGVKNATSTLAKIVLKDETLYAEVTDAGNGETEGETNYASVPAAVIEDLIRAMIEGNAGGKGSEEAVSLAWEKEAALLRENIPEIPGGSSDITEILTTVLGNLGQVIKAAFLPTTEANGYSFALNFGLLDSLNEALSTMSVADIYNLIYGIGGNAPSENPYGDLSAAIVENYQSVLGMTVADALAMLEQSYGINLQAEIEALNQQIAAVSGGELKNIDELIFAATQGKVQSNITGLLSDKEFLAKTVKSVLTEIIASAGDGTTTVTLPTAAQLEMYLDTYGKMNVYQLIASIASQQDDTITAASIKASVQSVIDGIRNAIDVRIVTDKEGHLQSLKVGYTEKEETETTASSTSVNATLMLGTGYISTVDYSNVEENVKKQIVSMTVGNVYTDETTTATSEGNILTVTVTETATSEGETTVTTVTVYTIDLSKVIYASSGSGANAVKETVVVADYVKTVTTGEGEPTIEKGKYLRVFLMENGKYRMGDLI